MVDWIVGEQMIPKSTFGVLCFALLLMGCTGTPTAIPAELLVAAPKSSATTNPPPSPTATLLPAPTNTPPQLWDHRESGHDVVDLDDIWNLHDRPCRRLLRPHRISSNGHARPCASAFCCLADLFGYRLAKRHTAADGLDLGGLPKP